MNVDELMEEINACIRTDFNQYLKKGKQLVRLAKKKKDMNALAYGHFVVTHAMFCCGMRGDILQHALQAVSLYKSLEEYDMLTKSLNLLGIAYAAMEEHQEALTTYLEALHTAEKYKIKGVKDSIYNNIAAEYYTLGDPRTAIVYLTKIYNRLSKKKKPDYSLYNVVVYNLCDIYESIEDYDNAYRFLDIYGRMHEKSEHYLDTLMYYTRAAKLNYTCGKCEEANRFADLLVECLKNGQETYELLDDFEAIALKQVEIGEDDRADYLADYMWDYAVETKYPNDIVRACRVQGTYFDKHGEYEKAMYYYRLMDENVLLQEKEAKRRQLEVVKNIDAFKKKMDEYKDEMVRQELKAKKDTLTGLLNRSTLSSLLEIYVGRARTQGKTIGCIFMDVDFFKEYNDTYGHLKGDECLKAIGKICLEVEKNRNHIHFVRYGGDEIFCVASDFTDEELVSVAKEVAVKLEQENILHEHPKTKGHVTLSVGVVNISLDEESNILDIMNFSDKALYYSKNKGRDCISMFDSIAHRSGEDARYIEISK